MPADASLKATCHRTVEKAQNFASFVRRREKLAGVANRAIANSIDAIASEILPLSDTVDRPPTLGLVGGTDAEKAEFVTALLRPESQGGRIVLGQRRAGLGTIASILPAEPDGGVSLTIRFRHDDGSDRDNLADNYPVEVRLLEQLDIAAIIALICHTYLPAAMGGTVNARILATALESAKSELKVNVVPGMTAQDVRWLKSYLTNHLPKSQNLAILSALGYWDWLADNVAHLSESGRRNLLALLWGHEPRLNRLFAHLSDALDRLGSPPRVYCQHDALISSDPSTGWVARHRASIASAATLRQLADDTMTAGNLRLSTRSNAIFEMDRATFAAIAADITLGVEGTRLSSIAPTEIVAFPATNRLSDTTARLALYARAPDVAGIPADIAVQLFLRAKSSYLFDRACARMELTALIARVDPAADDDDLQAATIADWIATTQGEDAHEREKCAPAFAVVVSQDENAPAGSLEKSAHPPSLKPVLGSELAGLRSGGKWLEEWLPGRAFDQVYWLENVIAGGAADDPARFAQRLQSGAQPTGEHARLADRVSNARRAQLERIADAVFEKLAPALTKEARAAQIRRRLAQVYRRLRARTVRFHRSTEPIRLADWQRQTGHLAAVRLSRAAEARTLANLWRALLPPEADLCRVLEETDGRVPSEDPAIAAEEMAKTLLVYWLNHMFAVAQIRRLSREFNLSSRVLQHVVDELAYGAVRLNLTGILAGQIAHSADTRPAARRAEHVAAVAIRLFGSYLEMPAPFDWSGIADNRATEAAMPSLSAQPSDLPAEARPEAIGREIALGSPGTLEAVPRMSEQPHHWPRAFTLLVERNIAASAILAASSEIDRELGEYLAVFVPSPFEVD